MWSHRWHIQWQVSDLIASLFPLQACSQRLSMMCKIASHQEWQQKCPLQIFLWPTTKSRRSHVPASTETRTWGESKCGPTEKIFLACNVHWVVRNFGLNDTPGGHIIFFKSVEAEPPLTFLTNNDETPLALCRLRIRFWCDKTKFTRLHPMYFRNLYRNTTIHFLIYRYPFDN